MINRSAKSLLFLNIIFAALVSILVDDLRNLNYYIALYAMPPFTTSSFWPGDNSSLVSSFSSRSRSTGR